MGNSTSQYTNRDDIYVTKEEIENLVEITVHKTLDAKSKEILQKDAVWKRKYEDLYKKYETVINNKSKSADEVKSKISTEAVDQFVKDLLADPNVNIYGFPDVIEGGLYRNVLKSLLSMLVHASNTSNISIMGHKVRIIIEPNNSSNTINLD